MYVMYVMYVKYVMYVTYVKYVLYVVGRVRPPSKRAGSPTHRKLRCDRHRNLRTRCERRIASWSATVIATCVHIAIAE